MAGLFVCADSALIKRENSRDRKSRLIAAKLVWSLLIFALPVIGVVVWLIFGLRGGMQIASLML